MFYCKHHAPFCGTVKFGKHNAVDVDGFVENFHLRNGVLSRGSVQHDQVFSVRLRKFPVHNTVDFFQLFHEVFLVVQTACSVHKHYVRSSAFGGRHRIEHHGCGVASFFVFDDAHLCTVCPHFKLVACGSPECVGGGNHHRFALFDEYVCKFADGRCFANAVDPCHRYYAGSVERKLFLTQNVRKHLFEILVGFFRVGYGVVAHTFTQRFYYVFRRLLPHVASQKDKFQFLVEILVENATFEKFVEFETYLLLCFAQTVDNFFEKSHCLSSLGSFYIACLMASVSLTDTIFEMPFSSIVTPYNTFAFSIVGFLWVMTTNCVEEENFLR